MNNIEKFFLLPIRGILAFLISWIPKPQFSSVTFWKAHNKKYLYYCISEDHIQDEYKFRKAFPDTVRISQFEFDALIFLYPERQVVEVGDAGILDEFEDEGAPDDDTHE